MEDLTGKEFGAYRIVAPLGEGGMASVYQAYQASIDRYVALKVLPKHYSTDPDFVHRFEREARVIAQLEHPHILPVHDYGQAEGYSYLVMRYVKGGDLSSLMQSQPLTLEQICKFITEVASALDYAHSKGVIHRDIKPSNVLIDEQGNSLLSDFGLAKMVIADSQYTASGAFIGTPTYASPEQCLGRELDPRSDIYSLGIMLYEMCVGRPPYRADTPMGIVIKHIHDPLPLPHSINPQISEAVEGVILKALAKEPGDRFQKAGEMAVSLRAAVQGEALPASSTKTSKGTIPSSVETSAGKLPVSNQPPSSQPPASAGNAIPAKKQRKVSPLMIALGCVGIALVPLALIVFAILIYGAGNYLAASQRATETISFIPSPVILAENPTNDQPPVAAAPPQATPTIAEIAQMPTAAAMAQATSPATPAPLPPQGEWAQVQGLPGAVNAIAIDPANSQVVYAGAGQYGSGSGVYKSTDGGQTWNEVLEGLPREDVRALAFSGAPAKLFAVAGQGIYSLASGETTWQKVYFNYSFYSENLVVSPDARMLFAWYGGPGLLRSSDQGVTFSAANQGLPAGDRQDIYLDSVAIAPSDNNIVYLGTGWNHQNGNGVYKSTDGGQNWKAAHQGMLDQNVTALAVDPQDAQVVYAGVDGGGLYKSTDGGENWTKLRAAGQTFSNWVKAIVLSPDKQTIYLVTNSEGPMSSTDGGVTWQSYGRPGEPYDDMMSFAAAFEPKLVFYFSTRSSGAWKYTGK